MFGLLFIRLLLGTSIHTAYGKTMSSLISSGCKLSLLCILLYAVHPSSNSSVPSTLLLCFWELVKKAVLFSQLAVQPERRLKVLTVADNV